MDAYPSNTKKVAAPEKPEKIQKLTTGPVILKKKGFGSRFKDAFTGDDGRGVLEHVLWDVLIPSAKDMIADAGQEALNRALYGDSRSGRRPSPTNYASRYAASTIASRVNYSRPSTISDPREKAKVKSQSVNPTRGQVDFQDIILSTRVEAENIIYKMNEFVDQFEQVTIADLLELVGVTAEFTDQRYGWTDVTGARPRKMRDGYLLDLPAPVQLD